MAVPRPKRIMRGVYCLMDLNHVGKGRPMRSSMPGWPSASTSKATAAASRSRLPRM